MEGGGRPVSSAAAGYRAGRPAYKSSDVNTVIRWVRLVDAAARLVIARGTPSQQYFTLAFGSLFLFSLFLSPGDLKMLHNIVGSGRRRRFMGPKDLPKKITFFIWKHDVSDA